MSGIGSDLNLRGWRPLKKNGYLETCTCTIRVFADSQQCCMIQNIPKLLGLSDFLMDLMICPTLLLSLPLLRLLQAVKCSEEVVIQGLVPRADQLCICLTKHIEGQNISGGKQRKAVKPTALDLNLCNPTYIHGIILCTYTLFMFHLPRFTQQSHHCCLGQAKTPQKAV